MITQSGCFGSGIPSTEQIDTAAEAAAVVDALESAPGAQPEYDPTALAVVQMGVCCQELRRRVRLLTWAVVAIAFCLVLKEVK